MSETLTLQSKLPNLGISIFSEMTALANQYKAINLSQGFPEFDAPDFLKQQVTHYIDSGLNQYAPSPGLPALQDALVTLIDNKYAHQVTQENITITSGATEALFVAIQSLVKQGDEVIVFDPAYDSYEPAIRLAGGKAIHIQLNAPDYAINWQHVAKQINGNTKAIIINTPHNPSASTLCEDDIKSLQTLLREHPLYVISDEVYEHITFDDQPHLSLLRYPDIAQRAFVVSSFGKTFHCTGWKLGYCVAPNALMTEFRKIHQYVTFSSFTPAQAAIADMLSQHSEHVDQLANYYQKKRDLFISALSNSRFSILPSKGTYFLLLDYSDISDKNDLDFCHWLTKEIGVAAIPLSVFNQSKLDEKIIRLCFAKEESTLLQAAERLCRL